MIAVKIALTFKENKDLIEINSKIRDNLIVFDNKHVPHVTLLQFITKYENIWEMQKIIDKELIVPIKIKVVETRLLKDKKGFKNFYFKTFGKEISSLHFKWLGMFEKYIYYPKLQVEDKEDMKTKKI